MNRPLAGLTRSNVGRELMAGVTLIAIAIPLNIGYAQIAGLPPAAGLYALIVPTILYALVVSSRQLVASPDAASAALVASSLGGLAVAGSADYATLALAQAIICGILFLLLAVFKLGFLAGFLSRPILVGFIGGVALEILVLQIAKMLGVQVDSGAGFLGELGQLVTGLGTTNAWSLLLSVASVAVLVGGRRLLPVVPWALVVLVGTTVAVGLAGDDRAGVAVLGGVPQGIPALTWPVLDPAVWLALIPSAIALTLVTTAEALPWSRAYAAKRHYPVAVDRDLIALGVANVAAGASGGFTIGASTSRADAMDRAGSRTQLPALVLAAGTLVLIVFGTALLADIPSPAIGAIVAVAILPLLGIREFIGLWRLDRVEFAIGAVCFAVALLFGAIAGAVVAFALAVVLLVKHAANPAIDVLSLNDDAADSLLEGAPTGSVTAPGVIVVRPASPLFFANGAIFTQAVQTAVTAAGGPDAVDHVVIDMEAVNDVDATASESFACLREWLDGQTIILSFSRVRSGARPRLERFGIIEDETVFATNRAALDSLTPQVGWREKLWQRLAGAARIEGSADAEAIHITKSSN